MFLKIKSTINVCGGLFLENFKQKIIELSIKKVS